MFRLPFDINFGEKFWFAISISFSIGVQSFMNRITSSDPLVFSGFQNLFIPKNLFQDKNSHVSVTVPWFSEMVIELVLVYMVPIVIQHVNGINMLSPPGLDVTSFAQILGQKTNATLNPVHLVLIRPTCTMIEMK